MGTEDNRKQMTAIFDELAKGDAGPFVEAMAEDFTWTVTGSSVWSKTFTGKRSVQKDFLGPLFAQFADRYTGTASRILADGDYVIVEFRGSVTTRAGKAYRNAYCYVIRMADSKMKELTEYMDTAHAEALLRPPG